MPPITPPPAFSLSFLHRYPLDFNLLPFNQHPLYQTPQLSLSELLTHSTQAAGGLLWGLALLGWLAMRGSKMAGFVMLFAVLDILIWLGLLRHDTPHHLIHFTPFIVWGLVGLVAKARRVGVFVWLLVGLNAVAGLTLYSPEIPGLAQGFSPQIRQDYTVMAELVTALREMPQPVYVAASSEQLNPQMIENAERQLYPENLQLSILSVPQQEEPAEFPLVTLLAAQTVVVPDSLQVRLTPREELSVVQVVWEMFDDKAALLRDFLLLNREFELEKVRVQLYRRVQRTRLATAIETVASMQRAIAPPPERSPQWAVLSPDAILERQATEHEVWGTTPLSLLYLQPLSHRFAIRGNLRSPCPSGRLQFRVWDASGDLLQTQEFPLTVRDFVFGVGGIETPVYMSLSLQSSQTCSLRLSVRPPQKPKESLDVPSLQNY